MRWTTLGLIIAIFALLGIAYLYLGYEDFKPAGWFVDEGKVRGSALMIDETIYTLNWPQQQTLIDELNAAKQINKLNRHEGKPLFLVYIFDKEKPISLIPQNEDLSIFSVSSWSVDAIEIEDPSHLKSIIEDAQ